MKSAAALLLLLAALLAAPLAAQRGERITSPEVHDDRRITFRLKGPGLQSAVVEAPWAGDPVPMTQGDDGLWTATIGPVPPQIYGYKYKINGVSVLDPHNAAVKLWLGGAASLVEVPGDDPQPYDWTSVPHGDLHVHHYASSVVDRERRLYVYTPPGYAQSKQKYPTLYLLHGSGDDESTWSTLGKANFILDNLIAQGKAKPMVVVMTNGHPVPWGTRSPSGWARNTDAYVDELTTQVMPMIESAYRVKTDRESRAITGLSMGGGQSLAAGLSNPDKFAWIGAFSSAAPVAEEAFPDLLADPESFNKRSKLLWIAIGEDDFLLERNEAFQAALKKSGIEHTYKLTPGDHSWPVWRSYLAEFVPMLF